MNRTADGVSPNSSAIKDRARSPTFIGTIPRSCATFTICRRMRSASGSTAPTAGSCTNGTIMSSCVVSANIAPPIRVHASCFTIPTIVVTQVVTRHVFWLGQRTMVGIVKQEARTRMGGAIFADTTHELMIVPFVHDDEVGAVDQLADLVVLHIVKVAHELGNVPMKVGERARSLIAEEMGETPSAVRFIYLHLVPARLEFAHHATQEVGIAVIPVGHQRVIEHHDTHGWPSLAGAHAARGGSALNMER